MPLMLSLMLRQYTPFFAIDIAFATIIDAFIFSMPWLSLRLLYAMPLRCHYAAFDIITLMPPYSCHYTPRY